MLEIFYDVLALQFLQQLDDIAFNISKIEVLGKRMYLATMVSWIDLNCVVLNLSHMFVHQTTFSQGITLMDRHRTLQLVSRGRKTGWVSVERSNSSSRVYIS